MSKFKLYVVGKEAAGPQLEMFNPQMIKYEPREFLKKIAPKSKIEKLMTGKLTVNRAVLSLITEADFISKKTVETTALKTIRQYKEKYYQEREEGATPSEAKEEALNDKKLLINRVQNTIVNQVAGEIKDQYQGEFYKWLPSESMEPDPLHQLNYGKTFQIGKGEMPGERYGCKCGMQILVKETKLEL
jgi:hypothetical protein